MSFASLGLNPATLKAVESAGYTEPTPVQTATIPAAMARQDLLVSSQTGSGKTAAFMLPALEMLGKTPVNKGFGPRMLVLAHDPYLAHEFAIGFGSFCDLQCKLARRSKH